MANTTYISTEDKINSVQSLKRKTKLKFFKIISNYYDNMSFRMDEDPFAKSVQGNDKTYHEVLLLMKLLQTNPPVKKMNKYYDLYYTVIKNRDDKEIVDDQYKNHFIFLMILFLIIIYQLNLEKQH